MGDRAQSLGECLRYDTSLGPLLSELAILVTARFWTSHFEWYAHKRYGLEAGIDPTIIDAIATRQPPAFTDPKMHLVYDYATTLHHQHGVPAALHEAAVASLGENGVVELVGLLGYYTLVSMTLNAFEIGLPEGETPELAE
jgi:4-carboxymuconolactone decarboxylase